MVARVARFEGINVQEVEKTMDQADAAIRPMVEALQGYKGSVDLMSPDGVMLSITLFESDADVQAAQATFEEEMPRKLGNLFQGWEGRRVSVEQFNVLSDSRA